MPFEPKDGFGALFQNEDYEPGQQRPRMKGTIMLGGTVYELAAWTRENKNGDKYFSLRGKPPQDRAPPVRKPIREDLDDEIPY